MAARIGGSRLEMISSLFPVKAIMDSVQVMDTAMMSSGTIIVLIDLNKIKRKILMNKRDSSR